MMKKTVATLALQLILSTPSMASTELLLPGYPNRGAACETNAAHLARKVGDALQASFSHGECTLKKWTHSDIKVSYTANTAITSDAQWPVYPTEDRCMAAMASEANWFSSVTGLSPFLQYCSQDRNSTSFDGPVYGYSPRIYAAGTPKKVIKSHFMRFNGYYFGPKKSTGEILKKSKDEGIPLVQAQFADYGFESELWLRFVVDPKSPYLHRLDDLYLLNQDIESNFSVDLFREVNPMRFSTGQKCYDQLKRAEEMMAPYWEGPVVWFCTWDRTLFRANLYHLQISPGWERFTRIVPGEDGEPIANRYGSFEACEGDKARVVAHYKKKLGDSVIGALCGEPKGRDSYFKPAQVFLYIKE